MALFIQGRVMKIIYPLLAIFIILFTSSTLAKNNQQQTMGVLAEISLGGGDGALNSSLAIGFEKNDYDFLLAAGNMDLCLIQCCLIDCEQRQPSNTYHGIKINKAIYNFTESQFSAGIGINYHKEVYRYCTGDRIYCSVTKKRHYFGLPLSLSYETSFGLKLTLTQYVSEHLNETQFVFSIPIRH